MALFISHFSRFWLQIAPTPNERHSFLMPATRHIIISCLFIERNVSRFRYAEQHVSRHTKRACLPITGSFYFVSRAFLSMIFIHIASFLISLRWLFMWYYYISSQIVAAWWCRHHFPIRENILRFSSRHFCSDFACANRYILSSTVLFRRRQTRCAPIFQTQVPASRARFDEQYQQLRATTDDAFSINAQICQYWRAPASKCSIFDASIYFPRSPPFDVHLMAAAFYALLHRASQPAPSPLRRFVDISPLAIFAGITVPFGRLMTRRKRIYSPT